MNETFSFRLVVFLSAWLWSVVIAADGIVPKNLPGGYTPAEIGTEVNAAADFAVGEEARREAMPLKLTGVIRAEQQIVAGTNYRLLLSVERASSTLQAKVIVFRDLKSRYSLQSWKWL